MFKAYRFPYQLFFFFENLTLVYWTSKALRPQHYVIFWPVETLKLVSQTLKFETFLSFSFLVEASIVDTSCYNPDELEVEEFLRENRYLSFYIFYLYQLKTRLTCCFSSTAEFASIETIYPNAGWLEREMIELYGVFIKNKRDSRNLLLDYTNTSYPMQKSYACTGELEVFYNPLDEVIAYYPTASVEL